MSRKILGIAGIFLVGIALGIIANTFSPVNLTRLVSGDVSSKVESLYELTNPGIDVNVVKIDQVSGMYKVLFKAVDAAGGVTYREAYISQDGKLLTENMIIVEQSITQISKSRDFITCLYNKGVRLYGILNQTINPQVAQATLVQLNTLGLYSPSIYIGCDANLQACLAGNVTRIPAVTYQGKEYDGPQSIQFFESLTACKF